MSKNNEQVATNLSRVEAVDELAREMYWRLETLDPTEAGDWNSLTDDERHIYREVVEWLLLRPNIIRAALPFSDNDSVNGRP